MKIVFPENIFAPEVGQNIFLADLPAGTKLNPADVYKLIDSFMAKGDCLTESESLSVLNAQEPRRSEAESGGVVGCDPFYDWPIEKVRRLRNACLGKLDGEWFEFEGVIFVMPTALFRSNSRLLLDNADFAGPRNEVRQEDSL